MAGARKEVWYGMQERADRPDEAELGMAANSILQSIPRHILKALEQQQAEANEVNAESKVRRPVGYTSLI